MNLRMRDADGDHLASIMVRIDTDGVQPQDDWDALGMRGSGSQSVVFDNVHVAKHAVRTIGAWGEWNVANLTSRALGNLPLVGAFLGHGRSRAQSRPRESEHRNAGSAFP